jgi:hypothetical protein
MDGQSRAWVLSTWEIVIEIGAAFVETKSSGVDESRDWQEEKGGGGRWQITSNFDDCCLNDSPVICHLVPVPQWSVKSDISFANRWLTWSKREPNENSF